MWVLKVEEFTRTRRCIELQTNLLNPDIRSSWHITGFIHMAPLPAHAYIPQGRAGGFTVSNTTAPQRTGCMLAKVYYSENCVLVGRGGHLACAPHLETLAQCQE